MILCTSIDASFDFESSLFCVPLGPGRMKDPFRYRYYMYSVLHCSGKVTVQYRYSTWVVPTHVSVNSIKNILV
jgi:hypothetical protein